jgi:hypothetical protein
VSPETHGWHEYSRNMSSKGFVEPHSCPHCRKIVLDVSKATEIDRAQHAQSLVGPNQCEFAENSSFGRISIFKIPAEELVNYCSSGTGFTARRKDLGFTGAFTFSSTHKLRKKLDLLDLWFTGHRTIGTSTFVIFQAFIWILFARSHLSPILFPTNSTSRDARQELSW